MCLEDGLQWHRSIPVPAKLLLFTSSSGRTNRVRMVASQLSLCSVDVGEALYIPPYIDKASLLCMYSMTQPDNVYLGPPTKLVKLEPSIHSEDCGRRHSFTPCY